MSLYDLQDLDADDRGDDERTPEDSQLSVLLCP